MNSFKTPFGCHYFFFIEVKSSSDKYILYYSSTKQSIGDCGYATYKGGESPRPAMGVYDIRR
jgi:hypothetical protein